MCEAEVHVGVQVGLCEACAKHQGREDEEECKATTAAAAADGVMVHKRHQVAHHDAHDAVLAPSSESPQEVTVARDGDGGTCCSTSPEQGRLDVKGALGASSRQPNGSGEYMGARHGRIFVLTG